MPGLELDLHSHLVAGVDDGSRGAPDTLAMARGLAHLGVSRVHLTPHQFRFGNEFTLADAERQAEAMRALLSRAGIELSVEPGAEYLYGGRFLSALERKEPWIASDVGGERCVLVELPFDKPVVGVRRIGAALHRLGYVPVLAHPERLGSWLPDPTRRDAWLGEGWRFQLNLLSLVGYYGEPSRIAAFALLRAGQYAYVGSDLHRPSELAPLERAHRAWRAAVAEGALS